MIVRPSPLRGVVRVPGDKSVTHRAIMLASVADGTSEIVNPGTGEDNLSTLAAMRSLGVSTSHDDAHHFTVVGRGLRGLETPSEPIDCGNSGTTARLLVGLLAGAEIDATLTGDESLSGRPMRRVSEPLADLGYKVELSEAGTLPMRVVPTEPTTPETGARAVLKIASAQVKSCILLSGLFRETPTEVVEPAASRDHTERLLRAMGARVVSSKHYLNPAAHHAADTVPLTRLHPGTPLFGRRLEVPGDPSSAAFLMAAAALVGDEEGVTVENVATNPTRSRFFDIFDRMGAAVRLRGRKALTTGEPAADVTVCAARLKATEIRGFEIPLVIDEIPILAVLGAASEGRFVVRDAQELRVKESDRIERTAALLRAIGVEVEEFEDGFAFEGRGSAGWPAFSFACGEDHRIAMAAVVAALASEGECDITETECISVSFPSFVDVISTLGAEVVA